MPRRGSAFATPDAYDYLYNARSELTNATAAVDSSYRYGYQFDDIGNREISSERGTNSVYTANNLNQYTAVDDFVPQFDDDGNQTLVKTATGIWQVVYNGENRPVLWMNGDTSITMSYDRMGRRVTKNDQRFVYNGYLQFADNNGQAYVWDPSENVATRPLKWNHGSRVAYFTHDGNKNVSEVISVDSTLFAHYEYAPFGTLTVSRGTSAADNPWRFSSEYAEDDMATVYYNYRHYEQVAGRWGGRDMINDRLTSFNLYAFCDNFSLGFFDYLGLKNGLREYLNPCSEIDCVEKREKFEKWYDREKLKLSKDIDVDGHNWVQRLRHCPERLRKTICVVVSGNDHVVTFDCYVSPDPTEWVLTPSLIFSITQGWGDFHPGGVYELRTKKTSDYGGHGNQCIYDHCGELLTGYPGGGTVDWISPINDRDRHGDEDVRPYNEARDLDRCCGGNGIYSKKYYEVRPSW